MAFQTGQLCVRVAAKRPIKMEVSSWEIVEPTGQALFEYRRVVYMFSRENHLNVTNRFWGQSFQIFQ